MIEREFIEMYVIQFMVVNQTKYYGNSLVRMAYEAAVTAWQIILTAQKIEKDCDDRTDAGHALMNTFSLR
jgi:hypothetical protein